MSDGCYVILLLLRVSWETADEKRQKPYSNAFWLWSQFQPLKIQTDTPHIGCTFCRMLWNPPPPYGYLGKHGYMSCFPLLLTTSSNYSCSNGTNVVWCNSVISWWTMPSPYGKKVGMNLQIHALLLTKSLTGQTQVPVPSLKKKSIFFQTLEFSWFFALHDPLSCLTHWAR